METYKHLDLLFELLPVGGRRVLDIGCGDGALVRALAERGAEAWGIDCAEGLLRRGTTAPAVAAARYLVGLAEALPLPDASFDIAIYCNSLHHVAVGYQPRALQEAARVLRRGGLLYITEPLAEGPYFEVTRIVDDEAAVRAAAYTAIQEADQVSLASERELRYLTPISYASFEAYRDRSLLLEPHRADIFAATDTELRRQFDRLAERRADGFYFAHPSRVNLLRRT